MSALTQLIEHFTQPANWQAAERLFRLHTALGADTLLVERVEGIEHLIGAPLPAAANGLLARTTAMPAGSLAAQQASQPQLMLGHTPLAPALSDEVAEPTPASLLCGYRFEITVLSPQSDIDLNALLGSAALLQMQTAADRADLRPFHGHITAAVSLGSNGGLARYRLVLEPWLASLRLRRDSWVFQNQTVADILTTVFADYQGQGALMPAWKLALADSYPSRSLLSQYRETDWHFVARLITAEGLACWFEHEGDPDSPTLGSHTLVISDRLGLDAACSNNPESPLRYHRADSTESEGDSWQGWREQTSQQPASVRLISYDDRTLSPQLAEASVANGNSYGPATRLADHVSQYAWAGEQDGQRRADNLLASCQVQARHVLASGTVRSLAAGQVFELSQHHRYPMAQRFRSLAVLHQGRNNLAADFRAKLHQAFDEADDDGFPDFYRNEALCLHARAALGHGEAIDTPFAPLPEQGRYHSKPNVLGVQTGTVVGQAGLPIDTDRNHRVKVQFHWQRGGSAHNRQAHASGDDNAPADERAWAWVRVGASQAGPNWGAALVPRIGQEVLVAFLDGDIDRPVIVGSAYNGEGNQDAQHNQAQGRDGAIVANAPSWFGGASGEHAHPDSMAGIKTQALSHSQAGHGDKQQGGYNQLVFDDTPASPRVELGSTQAHSWLQLGHTRHHQDNARREARSHGASLDTRGHAAIRAGLGLLLGSHIRPGGSGGQLDSDEAEQTLNQQRDRIHALLDRATKHHAQLPEEAAPGKLPVEENLKKLQDSLAGRQAGVAAWQRPELLLSAPQGLGWLTPRQLSLNATGNLAWIGRDIQVAAQATLGLTAPAGLRVFAGGTKPDAKQPEQSTGLKLVAASGKAVLQAQKDKANLNALKAVQISSNATATIASPTTLKLVAQGAGLELKGGNITLYAPKGVKFKAGMKKMTGAAAGNHAFPNMPGSKAAHFALKDKDTRPVFGQRYRIQMDNGRSIIGHTDEKGETAHIPTNPAKELSLHIENVRRWAGSNFKSDGDELDMEALHHQIAHENEQWQSLMYDLAADDE